MKEENRTESVTFRISPKSKKWLGELTDDSGFGTSSDYLNNEIRLRRRSLIFDKAMNDAKLKVGKDLGLTEKMCNALDGPEDIRPLFDEEKVAKYMKVWLDEFKKNVKEGAAEIVMQDIVDYMSTDEGNELLEFYFNFYTKIKLLNSISDELKTGRYNANHF
jgi:hypothetical protein